MKKSLSRVGEKDEQKLIRIMAKVKGGKMKQKSAVKLIEFTDPYCTWCWGSEPIIRHLQEVYGDQLQIDYVMGGLTDDSESVRDPAKRWR